MRIIGVEGLSTEQVNAELSKGAKFVIYQYCISLIVLTFRRSSNVYFIRTGEGLKKGLPFTLITFLLGWWGIPWGPIYSLSALVKNLHGGKDVTEEIISYYTELQQQPPEQIPSSLSV